MTQRKPPLARLGPRLAMIGADQGRALAYRPWTTAAETTTSRGYGAAWRRLRESIMVRDHGLCQVCARAGRIEPASEVDHIRNRADGGTDEPGNLQAICSECHRRKTSAEAAAHHARGPAPGR